MEKNNKNYFFTLGSFSKKHLILFFFSPFTFSMNNFLSSKELFQKKSNTFKYFSLFSGYILMGIILFIMYYFTKFDLNVTKNVTYFPSKKKKKKYKVFQKNIFLILILIAFLDGLTSSTLTLFLSNKNFQNYLQYLYPLEIISFCLLSKFLLHLEIYKHHYIPLIIIILGLLFIDLLNYSRFDFQKDFCLIIVLIIIQYMFPLVDILSYYILYSNELKFHLFLLITGIFGILFGFIISLFNYFELITIFKINIFKDFSTHKESSISFLISILCNGITYTLLYSNFKLFRPWFYGVSAVINGLFLYIINIFPNLKIEILFIYIFLIFQCLIFNEQIICNFWGLNKNTKREISKRADMEMESSAIIYDNNNEENEMPGIIIF